MLFTGEQYVVIVNLCQGRNIQDPMAPKLSESFVSVRIDDQERRSKLVRRTTNPVWYGDMSTCV